MGTRPLCVWCRKRKVEVAYRPFCSERCKMADLGQWLSGAYRVPGPPHAEASSVDAGAEDEPLEPSESTPH